MKKIIIPGGSGFLGHLLKDYYLAKNYDIVILTRKPKAHQQSRVQEVYWDGKTVGDWQAHLENAELVVNLAGKSVNCRYHQKNKDEILNSRILSTQAIGKAIQACKNPPRVWINSSSATIYKHNLDKPHDEYKGQVGSNFSENVCRQWEATVDQFETPDTRKIKLRLSIVFGKLGGAYPVYVKLAKRGLGGTQASGNQFISWLHEKDFCRMIDWLSIHPEAEGIYNGVSPQAVKNSDFMKYLRETYQIPFGLPAFKWMLELGAYFMGTETELILKSRHVSPARLIQEGFDFSYSNIKEALIELKTHNNPT